MSFLSTLVNIFTHIAFQLYGIFIRQILWRMLRLATYFTIAKNSSSRYYFTCIISSELSTFSSYITQPFLQLNDIEFSPSPFTLKSDSLYLSCDLSWYYFLFFMAYERKSVFDERNQTSFILNIPYCFLITLSYKCTESIIDHMHNKDLRKCLSIEICPLL